MQATMENLRVLRVDKEPWFTKKLPEKITSIEQLFGTLPNDIELGDAKAERLSK